MHSQVQFRGVLRLGQKAWRYDPLVSSGAVFWCVLYSAVQPIAVMVDDESYIPKFKDFTGGEALGAPAPAGAAPASVAAPGPPPADLPKYQEIGMPSLSPTMTQVKGPPECLSAPSRLPVSAVPRLSISDASRL